MRRRICHQFEMRGAGASIDGGGGDGGEGGGGEAEAEDSEIPGVSGEADGATLAGEGGEARESGEDSHELGAGGEVEGAGSGVLAGFGGRGVFDGDGGVARVEEGEAGGEAAVVMEEGPGGLVGGAEKDDGFVVIAAGDGLAEDGVAGDAGGEAELDPAGKKAGGVRGLEAEGLAGGEGAGLLGAAGDVEIGAIVGAVVEGDGGGFGGGVVEVDEGGPAGAADWGPKTYWGGGRGVGGGAAPDSAISREVVYTASPETVRLLLPALPAAKKMTGPSPAAGAVQRSSQTAWPAWPG